MQAIEKQLCVLESIVKLKHEDGFSIADIVDETGLNLSTGRISHDLAAVHISVWMFEMSNPLSVQFWSNADIYIKNIRGVNI